ncbi:MAG: MFS transporter [Phycisphaerae bacterium]|nr:MFS transporter [Gemmatimonadaceae bacterium]
MRKLVDTRPGEGPVVAWASAYYFLALAAYYVLRPIRDEIGSNDIEKLAWMFTGTMLAMLAVHPLHTSIVSKLPRRKFIPLAYRFFILNLALFFVAFKLIPPAQSVWVARVFFVWVSVFNLFVVSVFWSLIADLFRSGQGKRLFGVIAVGGTLGAMFGATLTTSLVKVLGPINLLLVSAVILELAVQASKVLDKSEATLRAVDGHNEAAGVIEPAAAARNLEGDKAVGGGVMDGVKRILSNPYLLGISVLIFFYTISSTFLYFQQADIVARVFADDRAARTRVFGMIDIAVNALTLIAQLFLTGRVIKWFGIGVALAFVPVITMLGFAAMSVSPVLGVLLAFQVLRRAGTYAIQRPGRETLFTVVARTDKYKAKNFADTTVYRFGDQVGSWSYTGGQALGLGLSGLAFTMVPLSVAWLLLSLWLARKYAVLERDPVQN